MRATMIISDELPRCALKHCGGLLHGPAPEDPDPISLLINGDLFFPWKSLIQDFRALIRSYPDRLTSKANEEGWAD